jgi:ribonuclease-3
MFLPKIFGDKDASGFASLEQAIGYTFKDKALLRIAMTNPSYRASHPELASEEDNQRLEFLGDAVFGLLAAEQLYCKYKEEKEGVLTQLRSHLVSGAALARLAKSIHLGQYLILDKGEEARGGREKDKYLTDALEATFGAVWQDGGWDAARRVYDHLQVGPEGEKVFQSLCEENPKGQLQQLAQRNRWTDSPQYVLVSQQGPSHAPTYTVRVEVATGDSATATAQNKHAAESAAAMELLRKLGEL